MLTDEQRKGLLSHADDMEACGWKDDAAWLRELLAASAAPAEAREAVDKRELPPLPASYEINWPELHSHALGCGVEDRGINTRYEAAEYGWETGVDRAVECVPEEIFTAEQMREYARAALATAPTRPTDDALWDQTLRERDNYHDWADKLANAIAARFNVDIGEHSNVNNPWREALEAIENVGATAPTMSEGARKTIPRKATPEMLEAFKSAYRQGSIWADRIEYALAEMLKAVPDHPASEPLTNAARDVLAERARCIDACEAVRNDSTAPEWSCAIDACIERIDRAGEKS